MARWRLLEPHYLFTDPGAVWEHMETERTTGRQIRKQYPVPRYFHHEAESDRTDGVGQMVVETDGNNAQPTDIIFKGEPTPGMMPLDDAAKAITEKNKEKWSLPNRMFDPNSPGDYATNLADHFVQQQDKVNMKMSELAERRDQGMDKFMETMAAMMEQNQRILEALVTKASGNEVPVQRRRVSA